MHNGSHSNTGGLTSARVLRTSWGLDEDVVYESAQDGDRAGSTLIRSDAVSRGRSHRRTGSVGDRSPDSGRVGRDTSGAAKKLGVDGMAGSRSGGTLSGLRGGPGSLSYASSADTREDGAHRRGPARSVSDSH
jgi:hypothetical protein